MVNQHIGYPGSVNSAQLATWVPNVGVGQYHVDGLEDGRVVTNGVGDRGVTVKRGTIIGDGIQDIFDSDTNLNFAAVAAGAPDRWDMVVIRRTWNATPGASTSVPTIIQGGPNKSLPARNTNKGVLADQPLALCRLKAGSTAVQEIVDLRCWAHNAGMVALDKLVMSYMTNIGTTIDINGETWCYRVTQNGQTLNVEWKMLTKLDHVQLGGLVLHETLDGSFGSDQPFQMQAGSKVVQTDNSGYGRFSWPDPFPNGLLTCLLTNGDSWASGGALIIPEGREEFWGSAGHGNKQEVVFMARHAIAEETMLRNQNVRINYIAIGW